MITPASHFDYRVINTKDKKVILIMDCFNAGDHAKTVTNDMENVLSRIADREWIDPSLYMVIYCDSEGYWDGYDPITGIFHVFHAEDHQSAIDQYIQKLQASNN